MSELIAEIQAEYDQAGLAFDRWLIKDVRREMDRIRFDVNPDDDKPVPGGLRLVSWGQGYRDMSPAIDALEIAILQRRFEHNGNPLLAFCFSNAITIQDPAGNRKLDKSATRFRIDGAVATAMVLGLKARDLTTHVVPTYQMLFM